MSKANVLLATFTTPYYNWLPYPVGCLISYVMKNPIIREHYHFLAPLYEMRDYPLRTFEGVDYLGLTNYVWNQGFNDKISCAYKEANPDGKVLYGGPNVPELAERQKQYRAIRTQVDYFFVGPGEIIFEEFLLKELEQKNSRLPYLGSFSHDWIGERPKRSSYILKMPPTPYTDGIFDPLLKNSSENLGAILETNRGCPFSCSFCDWGSVTRSKVNRFDKNQVMLALKSIFDEKNIKKLYFADANFGLYPIDVQYIEEIARLKSELQRHIYVDFCTTKNSSPYLSKILRIVHSELEDSEKKNYRISIQSHSQEVLKINNRSNIKMENFYQLVSDVGKYRPASELILGLPGETVESWLGNFQREVELKTGFTRAYKMQVLVNTEVDSPEFREKHKLTTRKFLLPVDLVLQRLRTYHNQRDTSFEDFSVDDTFIEFETVTSCHSFDLLDLKEMYSIWFWYSLLSNSGLAFREMRCADESVAHQYWGFKNKLNEMPLFRKIWNWHERSFQEIFWSNKDVVNSVENVNYIMKKPKYEAEIFLNLEQAIEELKLLYPTVSSSGIRSISEDHLHELYQVDSVFREPPL